jgi:hypothetical protein
MVNVQVIVVHLMGHQVEVRHKALQVEHLLEEIMGVTQIIVVVIITLLLIKDRQVEHQLEEIMVVM